MTIDPNTAAVVAGVGGAVAGEFVKKIMARGHSWMIELVSEASPTVKAKAESNLVRFVNRLSKRIERLESELPSDQTHLLADSFDDPETYRLYRQALLTASTTENDDRHEVLCELIAQRLGEDESSVIILTGQVACNIVSSLSSRHIKLLSLMVALQRIRPLTMPELENQAQYEQFLLEWWNQKLSGLCTPELMEVRHVDIDHLLSLNCAMWFSNINTNNDIMSILSLGIEKPYLSFTLPLLDKFKALKWWPIVGHIMPLIGRLTILTTVGTLIGIIYYDAIKKTRTKINW